MYVEGRGVQRSEERAFEYFATAAKLGDTAAIADHGHMLVNGIGVRADFVEGIAWIAVAASRGHDGARGTIDYFENDRSVSSADRDRVERRKKELERSLPDGADQLDDLVDYNRFVTASGDAGVRERGAPERGSHSGSAAPGSPASGAARPPRSSRTARRPRSL